MVARVALVPYADEDPRDARVRELVARLPEPRINLFTMLANAPALAGPTLRLGEAIASLVGVSDGKIRAIERGEIGDGPFERRETLALELIELLIVAGYYAMLGGVMRAVRLDVDSVLEKGMLDRDRLTGGTQE
jgi:hypothetical protein